MNQSGGEDVEPPWTVLVIMGSSGTGKSSAAKSIARRFAVPWLQVDDLRLAIESMNVSLSQGTDELYFFGREQDVWRRPVDEVRQSLIDVAGLLVPAVRIVIGNHLALDEPVVLRRWDPSGPRQRPNAPSLDRIRCASILLCGGGQRTPVVREHHRAGPGRWLRESAFRSDVPVVESRPFATLADRIVAAAGSRSGTS